eukprot:comp17758_c0_seq1/m.17773 comp17758_c0_seq1/g.17773  ORF comp17758_c0_seq1/g.17773 comp17758_c0_seq1/m.17773 type:complete len:191 (-) comp17758_c0_seq1:246-818(-)
MKFFGALLAAAVVSAATVTPQEAVCEVCLHYTSLSALPKHAVTGVLHAACERKDADAQGHCKNAVETVTGHFERLAVLPSKTACWDTKMCNEQVMALENDQKCDLCKMLVERVQASGPSAEEFAQKIESLCERFGQAKEQCEEYAKQIEEKYAAAKTQTPEEVCASLHMCDPVPPPPMLAPDVRARINKN